MSAMSTSSSDDTNTHANPVQSPAPTPDTVSPPRPVAATPTQDTAQQQVVAQQAASSPIERIISRLKDVKQAEEPGQWSARCPAHADEHNSLSVGEGADGKALLTCHAGCGLEGIVSALGLRVSDLFPSPGLTLTQYAEAKKLPPDQLKHWGLSDSQFGERPTLKIPYVDADMKAVAVRFRLSLTGPDKFRWLSGDKPCLYGLWMLPDAVKAGYVVLVEGESDCHTLWYQGVPALGVPGAASWKEEWAEHLKDIPVVYAVVEPDKGGETLRRKLLKSPSLRNRLRLISLNGAKDPSELHVTNPQAFASAWQSAVANATPTSSVDGEVLLESLEKYFSRYAALAAGLPLVCAVWSIATHVFQLFDTFPYLAVTSPTKRCGKSRLGELLELVCQNPLGTVGISPPALFRTIHKEKPTIIVDEAESLSSNNDRAEALREILNAGYRKGKKVRRCRNKSFEVEEFEIFCPKVLILIGVLQDTLADRCIPIQMKRRTNEILDRFRFSKVQQETVTLSDKIAEWVADHAKEIEEWYQSNSLSFLEDRDEELWLPLFAVCHVAAPRRVVDLEAVARELTNAKVSAEPSDLGVKFLADIQKILASSGAKHASTDVLLNALNKINESPWSRVSRGRELEARLLARLLKPFGIESRNLRIDGKVVRGYAAESFRDAWERYLPVSNRYTATYLKNQGVTTNSEALQSPPVAGEDNELSTDPSTIYTDCSVGADENGGLQIIYGHARSKIPDIPQVDGTEVVP